MSLDVRHGAGRTERDVIVDADGELYEILAHPRRSMTCSVLLEHDGSLSTTELVSRVLTHEGSDPDTETRQTVHLELYHRHLPKLADHGVIDWDREAATVSLADDPDVGTDRLEAFLEPFCVHRSGELFELLAHPRRRAILAAFTERGHTVSAEELATRVVAIERTVPTDAVSPSEATHAHVELRHAHLPAMADLGVVEYDHSSGVVVYRGHPALLGR